jgi:hypothetical protein
MPHEVLDDDLGEWRVTLTTGDVLIVRAVAVHESDEYLVFEVLMKGQPHYLYEIAKVPNSVVADWSGAYYSS